MGRTGINHQQTFFPEIDHKFPSTRYQGSKAKLADWIWGKIVDLDFETCLDAFGGTGSVAYRLKQEGKSVTYNDILKFNYQFGLALIENSDIRLEAEEIDWLIAQHEDIRYPDFIRRTFSGVYFTDEENEWIDRVVTNVYLLSDKFKQAVALFALCQACIIKRPYNLFHRKNLYIRLAEVDRSFGNKTTWDTPFEEWFRSFVNEANQAVFDNHKINRALNENALSIPGKYDLVYFDPPYISKNGVGVDYHEFYHFLEGLTIYDKWQEHIDYRTKHRRLRRIQSEWTDKRWITSAFDRLFEKYKDSILVVSYRSDGIPSEEELGETMGKYKTSIQVEHYGQYKYVLSKNAESKEILMIGT